MAFLCSLGCFWGPFLVYFWPFLRPFGASFGTLFAFFILFLSFLPFSQPFSLLFLPFLGPCLLCCLWLFLAFSSCFYFCSSVFVYYYISSRISCSIFNYIINNQLCTVNTHTGKKLSGKSNDEILEAVVSRFSDYNDHAVQQFFELIMVSFDCEEAAVSALKDGGVPLLGMWCRIDSGPPTTIVHLFDYPYEQDEECVHDFFDTYGTVKSVHCQKYISHHNVCTSTCLVDLVTTQMPPHQVNSKGYVSYVI